MGLTKLVVFAVTLFQFRATFASIVPACPSGSDAFDYGITWTDLSTPSGGTPPSARLAHGLAVYSGKVYLFGGQAPYANDLHAYDIASETWSELSANGAAGSPTARSKHKFTAFGGYIYLFGGEVPGMLPAFCFPDSL